ncbi:hypothetical protein, partial [Pseudomonas syringae group genomosp. 7]|uniref:hypothetical protein n=1 Tax=Pseudomonas syringae group genomosp. 7 TaxID=251699 RepID=UPI0037703120
FVWGVVLCVFVFFLFGCCVCWWLAVVVCFGCVAGDCVCVFVGVGWWVGGFCVGCGCGCVFVVALGLLVGWWWFGLFFVVVGFWLVCGWCGVFWVCGFGGSVWAGLWFGGWGCFRRCWWVLVLVGCGVFFFFVCGLGVVFLVVVFFLLLCWGVFAGGWVVFGEIAGSGLA